MITHAFVISTVQAPAIIAEGPRGPRGAGERRLTTRDLAQFGRCPRRWLETPDPEDWLAEDGPALTEWLAFQGLRAKEFFVRRPDTYEALVLRCPKCNSVGPAKHCTKCNTRRRGVVEPRAWSAAAKVCAQWLAEREQHAQIVVGGAAWDHAELGAANILADPEIKALIAHSDPLQLVEGVWQDPQTPHLSIPIWERVSLAPRKGTVFDDLLAVVVETRNADPMVWQTTMAGAGLHLQAALLLDLWNEATEEQRNKLLWIVVEKDVPRIVARRRTTPQLLDEGRKRYTELLAAYAQCLQAKRWPRFEPEPDTLPKDAPYLGAWAEVHAEEWLTQGRGPHGGYFAPEAVSTLAPAPASSAAAN